MSDKHPPTAEQVYCADQFATGLDLRINAYAGTGKTTTLKQLARSTQRTGTYLAFNKAIAEEARREFSRNVTCSTTHSLAFRSIMSRYNDMQKMTGSVNAGYLAAKLGLRDSFLSPDCKMTGRGRGYLIKETLTRWQRSSRLEITSKDVPIAGALKALPDEVAATVAAEIARDARAVWDMMRNPSNQLPLGHDGYLKLWALSEPTIPGQFIFLDEAQDTNGVVLGVMQNQDAQLIAVGDKHQQIYEWRGALNAMTLLPAQAEARLTTSFRFGPAIAGFATEVLALLGETLPLRGNPAKVDRIGAIAQPRAILCRTNARLLEEVLGALEAGERPFIVGGTAEVSSWVDAADKLQNGIAVESPIDFFGFPDWNALRAASETEEGQDLKRIVKVIEGHGVNKLRSALSRLPRAEDDASLVLATGHKSKGREWDTVRLCDDFLLGVSAENPKPAAEYAAELRLFYVAATRGKVQCEIPAQLRDKLALIKNPAKALAA